MQLATHIPIPDSAANLAAEDSLAAMQSRYSEYKIIRRNGAVVGFEPSKISVALTKSAYRGLVRHRPAAPRRCGAWRRIAGL